MLGCTSTIRINPPRSPFLGRSTCSRKLNHRLSGPASRRSYSRPRRTSISRLADRPQEYRLEAIVGGQSLLAAPSTSAWSTPSLSSGHSKKSSSLGLHFAFTTYEAWRALISEPQPPFNHVGTRRIRAPSRLARNIYEANAWERLESVFGTHSITQSPLALRSAITLEETILRVVSCTAP